MCIRDNFISKFVRTQKKKVDTIIQEIISKLKVLEPSAKEMCGKENVHSWNFKCEPLKSQVPVKPPRKDTKEQSYISVSYTHLDVYKRQDCIH